MSGTPSINSNTAAQDAAIHWISAPTSLLSFLCSSAICWHAVRQNKKRQVYHRLLIGLSFFDAISSGTIFCARFGSSHYATPGPPCTAIAGLQMWAVASATFYNVFLSFLFMGTVKFNLKEELIAKYLEPIAHLSSCLTPGALVIAGHYLEIWNPVTLTAVCWIGVYPNGCEGDECERGGEWFFLYDNVIHALFYLGILLMVTTNGLIYCHARTTLTRNQRYGGGESNRRASTRRSSLSSTDNARRINKVATRSFLFCGGYLITYFFALLSSKLESPSAYGTWWYVTITILSSIFWPLQGFFDSIIYFYPRYRRWRKNRDTWQEALYMTVLTTELPRNDIRRGRVGGTPIRRDSTDSGSYYGGDSSNIRWPPSLSFHLRLFGTSGDRREPNPSTNMNTVALHKEELSNDQLPPDTVGALTGFQIKSELSQSAGDIESSHAQGCSNTTMDFEGDK